MIQSTRRKAQSPVVSSGNIHALAGKARRELEDEVLAEPTARGTARLVLRELFQFFRGKAVCWPCNETLAEAAGVSPRTISRALKALSGQVIKTVEDSSVRSRRRIVLLAHPNATAELARLQASAPSRPKIRMTDCPSRSTQNGKVKVDNLADKPVNRSSSQFPSPAIPEPEIAPSNGERETPVVAGIPLTAHALDMKARAGAGDRIAQIEWDAICREMMRTAPADQIISQTPVAAPAVGQGVPHVEYLECLRPGAPSYVFDQAVAVLCRTFEATDDRDYRRAYEGIVSKVRRGVLSTAVVVHAFEQACLPSARNPGRVFAFNVERRILPGASQ